MADKVHCIRKTLRLMPQEAKVLSDKAKANGMNEAEYIRLLISQKPNDYPEVRKLLKELINEINRIGININQIVFNSNALYELDPEIGRRIARGEDVEILPQHLQRVNPQYGYGFENGSGNTIKRCSNCGYTTTEDFEFCPKCGRRL